LLAQPGTSRARAVRIVELAHKLGVLDAVRELARRSVRPDDLLRRLTAAEADLAAGNTGKLQELTAAAAGHPLTAPEVPPTREAARQAVAGDELAAQGLAWLESIFQANTDEILATVPPEEMTGFLRTLSDRALGRELGTGFFKGLAAHPSAMDFARLYGGQALKKFYLKHGRQWSADLRKDLTQAGDLLAAAENPTARQELLDQMLKARDSRALDKLLGKPVPAKPRRPRVASTGAMVDRTHPSWEVFRSEAERYAGDHKEIPSKEYPAEQFVKDNRTPLTEAELDLRADLDLVLDGAKRGDLAAYSHDNKLRILDRFDIVASQSRLSTGPANQKRGALSEALFRPADQRNARKPRFQNGVDIVGIEGKKQTDYIVPDYYSDETGVPEWVEQKSDLIGDPADKRINAAGTAAARLYLKHALADVHHLPAGSRYSIDFVRDPGRATRQAMLDILFSAGSPIYRVKFGTHWYFTP
jgi:hypothetical protein